MAIEDSPTGIASALAAGCVVVAVPCEVELSDVDDVTVVDSLAALDVAALRRMIAERAGTEPSERAGTEPS
jgi:beta-phosphoglucomutase-like phosphatase (HAD superfamily)